MAHTDDREQIEAARIIADEQEADIERRMNKAAEDASLIVAWDDETGEPIFAGEVRA
jgi:hypothetical protein